MKTGKIQLLGKDYTLCFSNRVLQGCIDRTGSMDFMDKLFSGKKMLENTIWLLSEMLKAGDKYAKMHNIDNPMPLSYDDIIDMTDISDIAKIQVSLASAIKAGSEIDVETAKNG